MSKSSIADGVARNSWSKCMSFISTLHKPLLDFRSFSAKAARNTKTFLLPALRAPRAVSPASASSPQILVLVFSDLRIDPRVRREARALADAGFRVKILYPDAMSTPASPVTLDFGPGVEFRPLPVSAMSYIVRYPHVLGDEFVEAACQERPFAIHAHDLSTALVGLTAAGRLKVPCICDFHEWYSENVTWDYATNSHIAHPRPIRAAYRWTERLAMARSAAIITVCESIARELERSYAFGFRKVHVIRNIPSARRAPTKTYPPIREQLAIPSDQMVVLWQGGTGPSRMLEPVIESLAHYERFTLVIRGPSLDMFGDEYKALATRLNVADRLILCPPVPSEDVVEAARGADCGVWTLPNLCKNFSYALPNKVFEYLFAGVPLLAADYPEVRRLVNRHQVGLLFDPYDPKSIASQIRSLNENPVLADAIRARIPAAVTAFDADYEWGKLVTLYQTLARDGSLNALDGPLGRGD
jgi:starch synthase